jgi:hypothetical protein
MTPQRAPARWLHRWVLHNWELKLLALALSILLWATYTGEPLAEESYSVPVQFLNLPPDLEIAGELPAQVRVRVSGRSGLLRRLSPADLTIKVDLAAGRPGDNIFPLVSDKLAVPYGARVERISPSEVHVKLVSGHAGSPPGL